MKNIEISHQFHGLNVLVPHLEHILQNTSASTYWKGKDHRYLGVNDVFVESAVTGSYEDVIGRTDLDFMWGEQQARLMQLNDEKIIYSGKPKTFIESGVCYNDRQLRYFLSHKTPLFARTGKCIGIFGISYILDGKPKTSQDIEEAGFSSDFALLNNLQATTINENYSLTKREEECLYYLAKGYTIKEIAQILQLSPRTIEQYHDIIKGKLHCTSRSSLVEKAYKIKNVRQRLWESMASVLTS